MNKFINTDGWLFVTLLYCGKDTTLKNILWIGDMLDRMFFTFAELNDGLSRLESEDLIKIGSQITLTDKAKKFEKRHKKIFENYIDKQLRYRGIFEKIPLSNQISYKEYFTQKEYDNAVAAILRK